MIATPHLSPALDMTAGFVQRVRGLVRGRVVQAGLMGLAVVVLGGMYVYREPVYGAVQEFVAKATGAEVARVVVEGATYTAKEDLMEALGVAKGEPLVGFNTLAARARLEALPWVRLAAVEKQLPDGLKVVVYERAPLARVAADDGQVWVVDKNGAQVVVDSLNRFVGLPLLEGVGASGAAAKLFGVLAEWPNLTAQLSKAVYVGQRRWDLVFTSGVTVQLPEEAPQQALQVLAQLEQTRHVLTLPSGEVDLRLPDRVVLRLPDNVGETPVTQQPDKQG